MSSLVTFGETMLRLSPPRGQRLSRTDQLHVHVGGAESNVAVAASVFDADAAWLSALPENGAGERIAHALRGEDVEPVVTWTDEGRVGTYYYERGGEPRGPAVTYDRTGSPIREVTPAELAVDRVREADCFQTSGITPALSDQAADTTATLLSLAQQADTTTVFDVNYRSKLWSPGSARETLADLFPDVDVLFVAERDARTVLDLTGSAEAIARALVDEHDFETVVLTQAADGALAVREGTDHEQAAYETETVAPLGSGDAFVGGFLARRLEDAPVSDALSYGAAMAALKRTIEGDQIAVSRSDVEGVLDAQDPGNRIDR